MGFTILDDALYNYVTCVHELEVHYYDRIAYLVFDIEQQ